MLHALLFAVLAHAGPGPTADVAPPDDGCKCASVDAVGLAWLVPLAVIAIRRRDHRSG